VKVRATGRAKREIVRAALWWNKNRREAPGLFLAELEAAERHLRTAPRFSRDRRAEDDVVRVESRGAGLQGERRSVRC
jgi:hypothetical protein